MTYGFPRTRPSGKGERMRRSTRYGRRRDENQLVEHLLAERNGPMVKVRARWDGGELKVESRGN
jgi:hypothetical protein